MKPKVLKLEYENPKTHVKSTGRIEIKNQTSNSADLYFYGDICSSTWDLWQWEDMCPQDVADFLNGLAGIQNINIYINSGGGDSFGGLAIFNILARNPAKMNVNVDALAASAAGIIAMVGCLPGNVLNMPPGTQLMIHNCWTIAMGNANDFEKLVISMRKCDESYIEVFTKCALEGVTAEQFREMQNAEKWLSGAEAALLFKNVQVQGEQIAASLDNEFVGRYKNIPKSLIKEKTGPDDDPGNGPDDAALQAEKIKVSKAKLALACEL